MIIYNLRGVTCRQNSLNTCHQCSDNVNLRHFVQSVEGGEWGNGRGWGTVILASYKFSFIRVHDNLVKDPSNNKSIVCIP